MEKHFTALEKKEDGSALYDDDFIDASHDCILLENPAYQVGINGATGALWFSERAEGVFWDMTGSSFTDRDSASHALYIYKDGNIFCEYTQGDFYDIVYEKRRPSLTAFRISENSVRLIYVLGIDQLAFFDEYPLVITEETYNNNELICSGNYKKSDRNDFAADFIEKYCESGNYYCLTGDTLPEPARIHGNFDSVTARRELLYLGYDSDKAVICMFVADITLSESGITVDISTNRQYRAKGVRTSMYRISFFEGTPPFVEKTDSESEYISFAGSKF